MSYLILVWVWIATYWQWFAGLLYGSVICRILIDWLPQHGLGFLVWYGWLWWVFAVLLVLALLMRFGPDWLSAQ